MAGEHGIADRGHLALLSGGGGVPTIMPYMERFRPKGVPLSVFRYIKDSDFHKLRYMKG